MHAIVPLTALLLAQTGSPTASLTFERARELAREKYPSLIAANLGARAAGLRAEATGFWDEPMLGVQLWQLPLNNVEDALRPRMTARERTVTFAMGPEMISVMPMISQTFPWPGKKGAERDEARARAVQSRADVEGMTADVDRAVAYAYAEVAAVERSMKAIKETVQILDSMIDISDARISSGFGNPADALAVRSDRESLTKEIIDFTQQRDVARARLAALLGYRSPAELPPLAGTIAITQMPEREKLIVSAIEQRAELKGGRAAVIAAAARARREKLSAFPDVTASASYMVAVGGPGMALQHGPYEALLGPADMVTLGVSIPLPIFAPWKQGRAADAASLEHKRARAEVDALTAVVQSDVDEALIGIEQAKKHMTLHADKLVPLARRTVDTARAAYSAGRGDVFSLLNGTRTLITHHLEYAAAEVEYARRVADLERATAQPLVKFTVSEGDAP